MYFVGCAAPLLTATHRRCHWLCCGCLDVHGCIQPAWVASGARCFNSCCVVNRGRPVAVGCSWQLLLLPCNSCVQAAARFHEQRGGMMECEPVTITPGLDILARRVCRIQPCHVHQSHEQQSTYLPFPAAVEAASG